MPTHAPTGPSEHAATLAQTVETIRTTIELGARQGFSLARIQLAPASLGEIRIHLQRTDAGVVAHVVAEHAAAAQTLQQGGDDLKRSLQSAGINLLHLDIQTRGDGDSQARDSAQLPSAARARRRAGDDDSTVSATQATEPALSTLALPGGALVNVLA
jgi:flagellar hook-length control protein FliK